MNKRTYLISAVGLITVFLSIFLNYSGFIFVITMIILITVTLLLSIWRLIKRKNIKSLLKITVIYFTIFALGIIIGLFVPYKQTLPKRELSLTEQIKHVYNIDQADRKCLKTYLIKSNQKLVVKRDSIRLKFADNIYEKYIKHQIELNNQDKFNIAMIFQHGKTTEDYAKAYKLASEVAKSSEKIQNAEWLEKATYDRLQISIGKPQKYGTQKYIKDKNKVKKEKM